MADSINPTGSNTSSSNFLPKYFQTDSNKKFLQATIDQLIQPGTVKKVNGYIGQQNAKASTGNDIFIQAPTAIRQNYQLEPGLTVKDELGNTVFFKDYQDFINQVKVFGGNTTHFAHLGNQEFYSWDPHICWDKFVNFQNYYWLPAGPDVIKISGQQQAITSTYTVKVESELDNNVYLFTPGGLVRNPSIKLYKGQTYTFEIDSPGNPFSIKTERVAGASARYVSAGIDNQAVEKGSITFTVPENAPDILFYVSEADVDLGGAFEILPITENTKIDVDAEIIGKKFYQLADGTSLSNGMKVMFIGNVTPAQYDTGYYYVTGVGSAIKLVNENILELISSYTLSETQLFDSTPFDTMPFSDATAMAGNPDYIVIDRGSIDHNPWSRYNRWFHKDVIETSAKINGNIAEIDQTARATRPIIEFEENLKLYNFGTTALADVDLVDTFTTDAFSTIEGQLGYNIDGVSLVDGHRILFSADTDLTVKNKIYKVKFLTLAGLRQIHLELDETPTENDVVLVKNGVKNQGQMFWFNGVEWITGQQKTAINQAPLFDVTDDNGISFSNTDVYEGSTFVGTKLFSYKLGTGTSDSTLGFPLSYKNINNVGDIVFNFDLALDTFQYRLLTDVIVKNINVGYLVHTDFNKLTNYVNGWQKCNTTTLQAAIRIYKNSKLVNNFDIDIFDNIDDLTDLIVRVYVNGIRLDPSKWSIIDRVVYKQVVLATNIGLEDVLTIKAFSSQAINSNGYYEVPISLQNNPLNETLGDFTLGEVIDHVNSIVDNTPNFVGAFPGSSNLRDLGNLTQYGTKFVQHSGPMSLSMYHMTSEDNNVIKAIEKSQTDYGKFKRDFIAVAESLGVDGDPSTVIELILEKINKDKPRTAPYYFSDMAPYGAYTSTEIKILDPRIKSYPLSFAFSLNELSDKSVLLYLNGDQLLREHDYNFDGTGFVVLTDKPTLHEDDLLVIREYENSDSCYIPPTPAKLGLYPTSDPKIYLDTSFLTPRTMIQGHDGSQVLAYGDYRDGLILELEKRIYNNIKVQYDPEIFDIYDILPGYNRLTDYSLSEFNNIIAPQFYKWTTLVDRDFTKPLSYSRDNLLTYNYKYFSAPDGRATPGFWRGIYRWMLDTDKPGTAPWEMLGFADEPTWWQSVYGPAPYTSNNTPLWQDLTDGIVREPGKPPVIKSKFARPFLINHIPVDDQGNVLSPLECGLVSGVTTNATADNFIFGDVSPVEATWRRSSYFPFSLLITALLMYPNKSFGTLLDRSRIVRNRAGQIIYKDTGLRVTPDSIVLPTIYSNKNDVKSVRTSGIINYLVDYILSDNLKSYTQYQYNLKHLAAKLSYRVAGFTSKEKFKLLLDSKTPLSQGSVFVPPEDYDIILNSSSPVKKITYSGVIVTKVSSNQGTGYEVKGYSRTSPYFYCYPWTQTGVKINVGGISEGYSVWTPGQQYAAGKVVEAGGRYYRVKALHTTKTIFDPVYYELLSELPIIGGREAFLRKEWDRSSPTIVPYGLTLNTPQEVVDFLLGYGEYLKDQGFIFDEFNSNLGAVTNWETSAKEFLFWTTQNWSTGEDKWKEWSSSQSVPFGSIVRYNGDYYRAIRTVEPTTIFNNDDYVKLDGLSTVGSSVISLSPSAAKLTFSTPLAVVDDIRNSFNNYEIFKVDGTTIEPNFLNSYRKDNAVTYAPQGDDGIYGASFYLVQKEQVVIINNSTMFNDTVYNPASGYRQQRIKISGYVNTEWKGSFDIPGFIFDQATIEVWENWKDYNLGSIVKYKEFYYSAKTFLPGTEKFNPNDWVKLDKKPTPQMLPNWTYKASQFTDFYSLDSDNFDAGQQSVAQHLIGYQKRQYLSNIIKDDVSEYKFYQGMIIEKGTQNVLNKLFDVLSADGQESLKFNEEWALRVGQYGASAAYENVEFTLDESLFKNNPQGFELVDTVDPTKVDFIIRQSPADVYLKPVGYNSNIWPIAKARRSYLRTPGYVRPDDVTFVLPSIANILNQDISLIKNGDYVWVGFENREWNVYRYTDANLKIEDVTYSGNTLTITLKDLVTLSVGQYIGISQVDTFSGFYRIDSVNLNTISLTVELTGAIESPFTQQAEMVVFVFVPQRATNTYDDNGELVEYAIDRAWEFLPSTLKDGELLWTDDDGTGKWAVWKYEPVYSKLELTNDAPAENYQYGKALAVSAKSNIAAVSTARGYVEIYDSTSVSVPWLHRQTLLTPDIISAVSWSPATAYLANDVVFTNNTYYKALQAVDAGVNPTVEANSNFWETLYLTSDVSSVLAVSTDGKWLAASTPLASCVPTETIAGVYNRVNVNNASSNLTHQGAVSLYVKDSNNIYTLIDTIVSPLPADNEKFGSALTFGNDVLFIGAPGSTTGSVYKLSYSTQTAVTKSYNPTGSSGTTVVLSNTTNILAGMTITGVGFTSGQTVVSVTNSTTITISAAPDSTPAGALAFSQTKWRYTDDVFNGSTPNGLFGSEIAVSTDNKTVVISAPGSSTNTDTIPGQVFVYKNTSTGHVEYSVLESTAGVQLRDKLKFGNSISITNTGEYIAVAATLVDKDMLDQGTVFLYKDSGTSYQLYQELNNSNPEQSEMFGSKVAFMPESSTLVVYSRNADSLIYDTFDTYSSLLANATDIYGTQYVNDPASQLSNSTTSFDLNLTTFATRYKDAGRVDIFDKYKNKWIFSESLSSNSSIDDGYGTAISVSNTTIFVSAPTAFDRQLWSGKVYRYRKPVGSRSWSVIHSESNKIDATKVKQAFLYNKKTNDLVAYLDVIDPAQGKIPGIADQEIKYKTFYDPATYSVGTSDVNVDAGAAWTKSQVGMLWWNLQTAKFYDSYDDDVVYRNSTWNTLFPGASIDIYEWVESAYKPSQWNDLADTEAGLAKGISGATLYSDSVYSVVQKYDNVAKVFKNTYYYWVKNKTTIPNIINRHMSAVDVAALIENPRGQGYKYLALTGTNTFSLVNVRPLLKDTDVVLSVEYWIVDNVDQNIHTQWKLISNNINSKIPTAIEQKWFDSLCGKDAQDRTVPDLLLPIKLRYGVENRPRQSMFVNRVEALKQLIEYVNRSLVSLIVDDLTISKLQAYDAEPSVNTGLYDVVMDTDAELRFANIGSFKTPVLEPVINNGKIVGVNIVESGFGYVTAPTITVVGSGIGAQLKATINVKGQVTGVVISNGGAGYTNSTILNVRSYSVLVHSDSQAANIWSIYAYDTTTDVWSRVRSQTYDTRKYWSYIDWYATGYNSFVSPDHAVNTFADLNGLNDSIGNIIKIRTNSVGNWVLLRKYSDTPSIDWTQQYQVVGVQNGTVQFNNGLYNFDNSVYGYDGSLYDGSIFDNSASTELRNILLIIRNNIFIDDLRNNYLDIFFNSIRYALGEQTYVDWAFKTSFVKAQHNVGELKEKVTYNNDNLADFESYVAEVKPYRTKIREYVSAYSKTDNSSTCVSDFDLLPVYDKNQIVPITTAVVDGQIVADNSAILQYPWKFWYDNAGFKVTELRIVDGGSGYRTEPVVRFENITGSGATARAFIANGKVNRIILITSGSGYLSTPTVVIDGGLSTDGTPARVVAIIGDSVVRTNLIKVKFDRITQSYYFNQLDVTETFVGTGSKVQFPLLWAPNILINQSTVTVDGVPALRDGYKLAVVKSTNKGYTSYSGSIVFDTAPVSGSAIVIKYIKEWSLLNAADRIQYYYNPTTGDIGKDLTQLMTGVDYGGVVVNGIGFDVGSGWDSVPYYTDKWGTLDDTFDDFIVTVDANTHSLRLPYVPENGTELNVYYVSKYNQLYTSDGVNLYYTFDVYADYPPAVHASIIKTVSGITATGVDVVRDIASNLTSTLTMDSTAGIVAGMAVVGTGFVSKQTVKTVVNETTVILSSEPNTLPDSTLFFTVNSAGKDVLTVSNTDGVKVKDIVTITPYVQGTIGYNTAVTEIISSTQVRLERIMFESIPENATVTFTRNLVNPTDYRTTQAGELYLRTALASGTEINISASYPPVRIDDPNVGTVDQTSPYAVMLPIIGDGVNYGPEDAAGGITNPIIIPDVLTVNAGDRFIVRKSTSDGSVAPQESDYDTAISGGDLAYSSASGLSADDIIIDGDDFVSPTTSPAPEEVVPGQVVDAVAIKVYDRRPDEMANISIDNFHSDGETTDFVLSKRPNSPQAIIVKVTQGSESIADPAGSTTTIIKSVNIDYTFDYRTNTVHFITAPTAGQVVSVFNIGFNGTNVLDIDYFVSDGVTTEFVTRAPWTDTITYMLYVDGQLATINSPELFKTDVSYESINKVGIRFGTPPENNALINFIIVDSSQQTFAVTHAEHIAADGREDRDSQNQLTGTSTYNLAYNIGNSLPIETSMIVRAGQTILNGPSNINFKISGSKFNYAIDSDKVEPYSLSITDLVVLAGGDLLHVGVDYTVDMSGIVVKLNKPVAKEYSGKTLTISIRRDSGYLYIPASGTSSPKIRFAQVYNLGQSIEVIGSYKHDILDIQRSEISVSTTASLVPDTLQFYNFNNIKSGTINLDRSVVNDNYVWVVKNQTLLTPTVDYKVNHDRQSITLAATPALADKFTLITFNSNVAADNVSYMQFKDMINRVHFKRLSVKKQTRLVKSLKYTDINIEVADASNFDSPNPLAKRPGIVEIRGERIEFYSLTPVVHDEGLITEYRTYLLGQLRRGTLGTGTSNIYDAGTLVQEIGSSETIPYTDTIVSEVVVSDGTSTIELNFIPTKADNTDSWFTNLGYKLRGNFSTLLSYAVNDVVVYNNYYYKCVAIVTASAKVPNTTKLPGNAVYWAQYTSIPASYGQTNDIEVFANGTRLKKVPYLKYSKTTYPDSPEGDVLFDAEFAVDGATNTIKLTSPVAFGTNVLVVKKTGVNWDGKSLPDGTVTPNILDDLTKVGKFIKAEPGISYVEYKKKSANQTFDDIATTFDSSNTTFDQG